MLRIGWGQNPRNPLRKRRFFWRGFCFVMNQSARSRPWALPLPSSSEQPIKTLVRTGSLASRGFSSRPECAKDSLTLCILRLQSIVSVFRSLSRSPSRRAFVWCAFVFEIMPCVSRLLSYQIGVRLACRHRLLVFAIASPWTL